MSNLALGVILTGLLVACACVYTFVTTDQLEWLAAGIGVVVAPLEVSSAASTVRCTFCGATNTLIHRNDG